MAKSKIKVRGTLKDGVAQIRSLIAHPMETGQKTNKKTGALIPAHFIQEVICSLNGKTVLTAHWGPSVSKNPTLFFTVMHVNEGDSLKIAWLDNKGETGAIEGIINITKKCKKDNDGNIIAESCKTNSKGKFKIK